MAAYHGADFLCYVTPAEHLCLPDVERCQGGLDGEQDRRARRRRGPRQRDGRGTTPWPRPARTWTGKAMYAQAMDPEKARRYRSRGHTEDTQGCSMCGDVCAIKIVKEHLKDKG